MRTPEHDQPGRLVTVRGKVASNGTIAVGDGRALVQKGATGGYMLLFSAFRAIINIALTADGIAFAQGVASSLKTVNVGVYAPGGAPQDTPFHFTVTGIAL